jgi:hypothetical protein
MADLLNVKYTDGTIIVDVDGKIRYPRIKNIPASVVDTSTHNHDDSYSSKASIEDKFNSIMNKVQAITKSLVPRPLKTKAYLNGGYKSSYVYAQRVQRFNAITETGSEQARGTLTSQYSPGGSSELCGYFFGDNRGTTTTNFNSTGRYVERINYATETYNYLGGIMSQDVDSTSYNLYAQTHLYMCDTGSTWSKLAASNNAVTIETSSATARGIGRQGLSSELFAEVLQSGSGTYMSYKYTYSTKTSQNAMNIAVRQQPAGLSRDKDVGYWIDFGTANNHRVNYLTNSATIISCFTLGFGESNTLAAETHGFAMGGYDGIQHDYVQKMAWSTEVAQSIIGGKLAIPQSSAGCCEA